MENRNEDEPRAPGSVSAKVAVCPGARKLDVEGAGSMPPGTASCPVPLRLWSFLCCSLTAPTCRLHLSPASASVNSSFLLIFDAQSPSCPRATVGYLLIQCSFSPQLPVGRHSMWPKTENSQGLVLLTGLPFFPHFKSARTSGLENTLSSCAVEPGGRAEALRLAGPSH